MHPVLLQIGSITIYTYGVLAAAGFLVGLWLAYRQAPRAGLNPHSVWNLGVYGILLALLMSKIWLIFSSWDTISRTPPTFSAWPLFSRRERFTAVFSAEFFG